MMKTNKIFLIGFVLLMIFWLVNLLFTMFNYQGYIKFLENTISPDGIIKNPIKVLIVLNSVFIIAAIFLYSAKSIIDSSLLKSSKLIKFGYFITILLIISFVFLVPRFFPSLNLYDEDNFFETLTAACSIIASIIMLICINRHDKFSVILMKAIISLLFFVFCMEEISWGQRTFDWKTPELWANLNYQKETNIHNLFNPLIDLFYIFFNLCLGILLLNTERLKELFRKFPQIEIFNSFIPSADFKLFGLIFVWLSFYSFTAGGELTEEVFSVSVLIYALEQLAIAKKMINI